MSSNVVLFPRRPISSEQARLAAETWLSVPREDRETKARELFLDDPETVLEVLLLLPSRLETLPAAVRDDAEFVYRFLERLPEKDAGRFLFDERAFCLGEAARIAAVACRHLSRRNEARLWLDRADAGFRRSVHSEAYLAKVGYQRLALYTEERRFREVMELLPWLVESFEKSELPEDALKCRYLEGQVLIETGQLEEAATLFRDVVRRAETLGNGKLIGSAYVNLIQVYGRLSRAEEAVAVSKVAVPLLQALNNRIDLAKVHWGLGMLFHAQGNPSAAVEAFRAAQGEFTEIGMRADVAALHLVVADLLLENGQEKQARWEIQAALPAIDELSLVPEGVAALALLRQSLQNPRINRQALRDLHGYFPPG